MDTTVNLPGAERSGPGSDGASHCLFAEPWWLDAVAPDEWGEVLVHEGDELHARLPFVSKQRLGVRALTQPKLTPMLGPWLEPSSANYAKRLSREHALMEQLIEGLPRSDLFLQGCHPSVTNWLPFYWADFDVTVLYTYCLDDLSDLDAVWSGFRQNIRREIRKAEKTLTVRSDLGVAEFLELNEKTFRRQNMALPHTPELVERLDRACSDRGARRIFFAVDEADRLHAALYVVWDEHSAYYLMSGADPELRTSGAGSLLAWEAIKFSAGVTRRFDFEGSMVPALERFFRSFGARQVGYLQLRRESRRGRVVRALQRRANDPRQ